MKYFAIKNCHKKLIKICDEKHPTSDIFRLTGYKNNQQKGILKIYQCLPDTKPLCIFKVFINDIFNIKNLNENITGSFSFADNVLTIRLQHNERIFQKDIFLKHKKNTQTYKKKSISEKAVMPYFLITAILLVVAVIIFFLFKFSTKTSTTSYTSEYENNKKKTSTSSEITFQKKDTPGITPVPIKNKTEIPESKTEPAKASYKKNPRIIQATIKDDQVTILDTDYNSINQQEILNDRPGRINYIIKKNDTMRKISQKLLGNEMLYWSIVSNNKDITNPDLIYYGDILIINKKD